MGVDSASTRPDLHGGSAAGVLAMVRSCAALRRYGVLRLVVGGLAAASTVVLVPLVQCSLGSRKAQGESHA